MVRSSTERVHTLNRFLFQFPRSSEYFNAQELRTMTGQPASRFLGVIIKELLDNSLDAAEYRDAARAAAAPEVRVSVRTGARNIRIAVADNGRGLPPHKLDSICNFQTRTSDNVGYRSPTRGAQGNALKTVLGIPYALGARPGVIIVESCGVRNVLRARLNPGGQAEVARQQRSVPDRCGTRVGVCLPITPDLINDAEDWARGFALFNPHATVRFRESALRPKR
jgi:DNA topoisomerase VI subunit B